LEPPLERAAAIRGEPDALSTGRLSAWSRSASLMMSR